MPRLGSDDGMQAGQIGGSGFNFKGTRIDHLAATEYTLVTVAIDETGSVSPFAVQLREMLVNSVEACKKSPRSDNILIRVLTFNSGYARGVNEIHGFMPLADIDTANYPAINPGGLTPLNDAVFSSVGATNDYAKQLRDNDYGVNGIMFVVTDGGENASTASMSMVKDEIEKSLLTELIESMVTVLIGVNTAQLGQVLAHYKDETGMTQYLDAGDATPAKIAKIGGFISQSVSSTSQALGTGGPSQNIAATI